MATLLLIIIYIDFIGLGIPDSLFGAAWPAIYPELGLPVSMANLVTILTTGGTIVSSLFSARLINRFGTARIAAVSTAMTAAALLGYSYSGHIAWMCLFALPLGLGAGAIDTALNNYVALYYSATQMSFLHCFYGIGVSVSPLFMSLALSAGSWRDGYRTMFWVQLGIAAMTFLTLPLWRRVRHSRAAAGTEEPPARTAGLRELLRQPKVRHACLVFVGSCGIEGVCGNWGSTYLVQARGLAADGAALVITFYYVGMAVGRFLSGVLAARMAPDRVIRIGQIVTLAAVALLLLPLPLPAAAAGLFLIGLGNGPLFPNMLHLTPLRFGRELSQSVIGIQMSAAYVAFLLLPALFGLIAQQAGAGWFAPYLLLMFAVMMAGSLLLDRKSSRPKP